MTRYVLDASALLRFTDREAGFERVRDLLKQAAKGNIELLISAVNWGEIVAALYKRSGARQSARALIANLAALPIAIVAVHREHAETAAIFRCDFRLPFADAFAGALTQAHSLGTKAQQATLITADYDFKNVPQGTIKIEFLPAK